MLKMFEDKYMMEHQICPVSGTSARWRICSNKDIRNRMTDDGQSRLIFDCYQPFPSIMAHVFCSCIILLMCISESLFHVLFHLRTLAHPRTRPICDFSHVC